METLDEIEERLATGGPSWEQVVQEVAGWDGRDGDPVPVALERAGLSRLRSKAWLRANPARRKELDAAAEVREERRKELVMATMMGIMVDLEAPVSARLRDSGAGGWVVQGPGYGAGGGQLGEHPG
jgi:hypothetical protein